jgi:hypothetical protein
LHHDLDPWGYAPGFQWDSAFGARLQQQMTEAQIKREICCAATLLTYHL